MRAILIILLATLVLGLRHGHARERFAGEFDNIPDNVRSWFKSVRSPHGVPCCDIADGHQTDYEPRTDNHYWIPIPGAQPGPDGKVEWMQVPNEAVVYDAGNPYGRAVVWWVWQGPGSIYIRCFVPAGGV